MPVKSSLLAILMIVSVAGLLPAKETIDNRAVADPSTLSSDHLEAVNRRRRIIFQDDVLTGPFRRDVTGKEQLSEIIEYYMSRLDEHSNQIDSVWHEWGEGNTAVWPSKFLPCTKNVFPNWWATGVDPVDVLLQENRKRGREVFFSYRMNGSDNDPEFDPPHPYEKPVPFKAEHPEWLIQKWHAYWNFAVPEVRELKLNVLREVAENYEFDGIQLDFARMPILFPDGQQWAHRDLLTDFVRQVRLALLTIEKQRGRPFLLAARVPGNLMGCHFDGMDIETWAHEGLVDILVLGSRSSEVDMGAMRQATTGTPVKLYPCWTELHSSDGYNQAPIEVYRGIYANWWHQKPDGVHTFNLFEGWSKTARSRGLPAPERWEKQCQIYREIGSPETLAGQDKVFFVQRRGGGHAPAVVPSPGNWHTPRQMYFLSNMLAPLPATLADDGMADTLLTLQVADDVNAATETIEKITLRLLLSDPAAKGLEVRINNLLLGPGHVQEHWLVFPVPPAYLAVGDNLVGVKAAPRPSDEGNAIQINKLELHVDYQAQNP